MAGAAVPAQLYFLTEDDWDDQVLLFLLEMMTGRRLDVVRTRLRRGGGIGEVRKKLALMFAAIRRLGAQDGLVFTVAVDNDRAVPHAAHGANRDLACRHCGVDEEIHRLLPDGRSIPGAIAVPVEMLEAWILLMHDPTTYAREYDLPRCARRYQPIAIRTYGAMPPPQLKDLLESECVRIGRTRTELAEAAVLRLDAEDLAARSPSFALFRRQVIAWAF
jgi:hypothetical protein